MDPDLRSNLGYRWAPMAGRMWGRNTCAILEELMLQRLCQNLEFGA